MSYKVEVRTGVDPKWYTNSVRLATEEEALDYGQDLVYRWTAVMDMRVVESQDPVNYRWVINVLQPEPPP